MDKTNIANNDLHSRSQRRTALGLSESEFATSSAQDRMRLSSSSVWALRQRGGKPDTAVTDDASDAFDVDSW